MINSNIFNEMLYETCLKTIIKINLDWRAVLSFH